MQSLVCGISFRIPDGFCDVMQVINDYYLCRIYHYLNFPSNSFFSFFLGGRRAEAPVLMRGLAPPAGDFFGPSVVRMVAQMSGCGSEPGAISWNHLVATSGLHARQRK
jgi:hypothetical protein